MSIHIPKVRYFNRAINQTAPKVDGRRRYAKDPLDSYWWGIDKNIGDPLDVGTRVTAPSRGIGTVECVAHERWRVVRWDNRKGETGTREYVPTRKLKEVNA